MNAVVQVLYHCEPFRIKVLQYFNEFEEEFKRNDDPEHILQAVAMLFNQMEASLRLRDQVISPDLVHKAVCTANGKNA